MRQRSEWLYQAASAPNTKGVPFSRDPRPVTEEERKRSSAGQLRTLLVPCPTAARWLDPKRVCHFEKPMDPCFGLVNIWVCLMQELKWKKQASIWSACGRVSGPRLATAESCASYHENRRDLWNMGVCFLEGTMGVSLLKGTMGVFFLEGTMGVSFLEGTMGVSFVEGTHCLVGVEGKPNFGKCLLQGYPLLVSFKGVP